MNRFLTALRYAFTLPLRFYRRFISPYTPRTCRFTPSCSEYAVQAVMERGVIIGTALAVRRVLRCNPFGSFGYDPVPPRRASRHQKDNINSKEKG